MDKQGIELINELLAELVTNKLGPCGCIDLANRTKIYLESIEEKKISKSDAWDKIKGNEYLKRAMEVSIAGNHPITIIGHPDNGEKYLEIILEDLLSFVKPCPCGNYLDPSHICNCSVSEVKNYRRSKKYQNAMSNSIKVLLDPPTSKDYSRPGETYENMIDRINRKPLNICIDDLDIAGNELMNTAIQKLGLTTIQIENSKKVAFTIAKLENSEKIKAYHLSEAIQYQVDGINF